MLPGLPWSCAHTRIAFTFGAVLGCTRRESAETQQRPGARIARGNWRGPAVLVGASRGSPPWWMLIYKKSTAQHCARRINLDLLLLARATAGLAVAQKHG